MKNHRTKNFFLIVFPIVMVLCGFPAGADAKTETSTFPVYDSIRPNVSFWKKYIPTIQLPKASFMIIKTWQLYMMSLNCKNSIAMAAVKSIKTELKRPKRSTK